MGPFSERKSFGKVARRGVALSYLREGVAGVLLFPVSMLMARLLSPREFGISVAALFFIQLASRLSEMGFNAALVRSKTIEPIHLSTVFMINVVVGLVAFTGLTLAAPWVGRFYDVPETGHVLPVAALSFLISPFGAVPAAILARELRIREVVIADFYHTISFAVLGLVLAWQGFSFWSLVLARVGSVVVQTGCRLYFAKWRPSLRFSSAALRDVLSFATGMHVKRLLDFGAQSIDNLIVGKLMGMSALGHYDRAFSLMNRFLSRLNTAGPSMMFRIFAVINEDPERFRRAYGKVLLSASLLGFPAFAVLIAVAPQLMTVLFGERWGPAAAPFQILCAAGALRILNTYASSAIQAAGRVWSEVNRQIIFIILIVASLVALREWGPAGAAAGVFIATLTMTVLMHTLLIRVAHLRWAELLRPQIPGLLCSAGMVAIVLLVEYGLRARLETPPGWLLLAVQAVAAAAFYACFLLFAPHPEVRSLVQEATNDLAPGFLKRQPWVRTYLQTTAGASAPPSPN